jgi:hypothetical protein
MPGRIPVWISKLSERQLYSGERYEDALREFVAVTDITADAWAEIKTTATCYEGSDPFDGALH